MNVYLLFTSLPALESSQDDENLFFSKYDERTTKKVPKVSKVVYSFRSFSSDFLHLVCFIFQVVYHIFSVIWLSESFLHFFWLYHEFFPSVAAALEKNAKFRDSERAEMTLSGIIATVQFSRKKEIQMKN
jgi:hypothetical protein